MNTQDRIFGLLEQFSTADELVISQNGCFVTLITENGDEIAVEETAFNIMTLVNDQIAKNRKRENPYAPYQSDRALQLKTLFLDTAAEMRLAKARFRPANLESTLGAA